MREAIDAGVVDTLVDQIVAVAQPLRIILCGSAVRGDSDLNVLVVMPAGSHRRHPAQLL